MYNKIVPRIRCSRIWTSAQNYAVLVLLLSMVTVESLISAWSIWPGRGGNNLYEKGTSSQHWGQLEMGGAGTWIYLHNAQSRAVLQVRPVVANGTSLQEVKSSLQLVQPQAPVSKLVSQAPPKFKSVNSSALFLNIEVEILVVRILEVRIFLINWFWTSSQNVRNYSNIRYSVRISRNIYMIWTCIYTYIYMCVCVCTYKYIYVYRDICM